MGDLALGSFKICYDVGVVILMILGLAWIHLVFQSDPLRRNYSHHFHRWNLHNITAAQLLLEAIQLGSRGVLRVGSSTSHGVHLAIHGGLHIGRSAGGALLKSREFIAWVKSLTCKLPPPTAASLKAPKKAVHRRINSSKPPDFQLQGASSAALFWFGKRLGEKCSWDHVEAGKTNHVLNTSLRAVQQHNMLFRFVSNNTDRPDTGRENSHQGHTGGIGICIASGRGVGRFSPWIIQNLLRRGGRLGLAWLHLVFQSDPLRRSYSHHFHRWNLHNITAAQLLLEAIQLGSRGVLRVGSSASQGVHVAIHGGLHVGCSAVGALLKSKGGVRSSISPELASPKGPTSWGRVEWLEALRIQYMLHYPGWKEAPSRQRSELAVLWAAGHVE